MTDVKCYKCSYEWNYKGKTPKKPRPYITCPYCMSKIKRVNAIKCHKKQKW